jgi:hypothetical protein
VRVKEKEEEVYEPARRRRHVNHADDGYKHNGGAGGV